MEPSVGRIIKQKHFRLQHCPPAFLRASTGYALLLFHLFCSIVSFTGFPQTRSAVSFASKYVKGLHVATFVCVTRMAGMQFIRLMQERVRAFED